MALWRDSLDLPYWVQHMTQTLKGKSSFPHFRHWVYEKYDHLIMIRKILQENDLVMWLAPKEENDHKQGMWVASKSQGYPLPAIYQENENLIL